MECNFLRKFSNLNYYYLKAISKSPMFSHFSESVHGVSIIRAFNK